MEFIQDRSLYYTLIMSQVERLCHDVYVIHDGIKGEGTVSALNEKAGQRSLEKVFCTWLDPCARLRLLFRKSEARCQPLASVG